jgi:hypothetical protein
MERFSDAIAPQKNSGTFRALQGGWWMDIVSTHNTIDRNKWSMGFCYVIFNSPMFNAPRFNSKKDVSLKLFYFK